MSAARLREMLVAVGVLAAAAGIAVAGPGPKGHGHSHGTDNRYGVPGDPKKPARTVEVIMTDGPEGMRYEPSRIEIKQGEQIRFVMKNHGQLEHEFVLATFAENAAHAKEMEKNPEMEHDEPNMKRLKPAAGADVLWRFTRPGEFQYACLIPGHMQAGMKGVVIVTPARPASGKSSKTPAK
jgi:uncharacterized cupredoxin-like copper-binding protein